MNEKRDLIVVWVILTILLVGGLVLAWNVGHLSLNKELGVGDVTKLLATFFVLALFVERTLEVFITAWRGAETVKRADELQTEKQALERTPANATLQQSVKNKTEWSVGYKCETQAIALRAALVLGILIAAVGIRSFDIFVAPLTATHEDTFWFKMQAGTFNVVDVLVSGGIIGGGSDAIHKLMNIITEFFDATAKKVKNS